MARRLRRRRRVQARIGIAADPPIGIAADPPFEADLSDTADHPVFDVDLTDTAEAAALEIDLTDSTVYESEITLESGDRLETGIVGCATPPLDADLRLRS